MRSFDRLSDNDIHDRTENQTEIFISLEFVLCSFYRHGFVAVVVDRASPSTMTATKPCVDLNFLCGILSPSQFHPFEI